MFDVEYTDEFGHWWDSLTEDEHDAIAVRVELLAQQGPALRRPVVGEIAGSRHDPQMKELRVGSLRVLFVFDPRQTAILLIGGDKGVAGWTAWYGKAIDDADALYDTHLDELEREGLI